MGTINICLVTDPSDRKKKLSIFFCLVYINGSCKLHMLKEGTIPGTQVPQAKASLNGGPGKAIFGNLISEW